MNIQSDKGIELLSAQEFEVLKKEHDYRCAVCGSREDDPHFLRHNIIVKLQQGLKDPKKPLSADNIAPQCQICYRWTQ